MLFRRLWNLNVGFPLYMILCAEPTSLWSNHDLCIESPESDTLFKSRNHEVSLMLYSPRASLLPRGKHSMNGAQSCLFTQNKACIMCISVDYIHLWESYTSMRYRNVNTGRTGSNHQRRGDPIRADLCFFSNVRDHAERAYCWILPSIVRSNPWSTLKVISKAHLRT